MSTSTSRPRPDERGHRRYSVRKIVSYLFRGKKYLALTLNLGLDGMKIKTCHDIPDGERLDMELVMGTDSIRLKGRIVHNLVLPNGGNLIGVQFIEVSEHDRNVLQNYLTSVNQW